MIRVLSTIRLTLNHARNLAGDLGRIADRDVALALRLVHLDTPPDTRLTLMGLNRIRLSVTASAHEDDIAPVLRPLYLRRHREAVIDVLRLLDVIEAAVNDGDAAPTISDLYETFPTDPKTVAAAAGLDDEAA